MEQEKREWVKALYQRLQSLIDTNIIVNSYSVCLEADTEVLMDFFEYLLENKKGFDWAEAYIQLYSWQFQTFHEGVFTYYENFYGDSDYRTMLKTEKFLQEQGYLEIAKWYGAGMYDNSSGKDCPDEMVDRIVEIGKWIQENEEAVYRCWIDLLLRYKEELLV